MKPMLSVLTLTLAGAAFILPALAADEHKVIAPKDVKWSPGPSSLPKGAEVAMLAGDPSKEGPFVMRLKFPSGYQVPPHTHPKAEVVTVISGTVHVGMGETADKSKAQALAAGGFSPCLLACSITFGPTGKPLFS